MKIYYTNHNQHWRKHIILFGYTYYPKWPCNNELVGIEIDIFGFGFAFVSKRIDKFMREFVEDGEYNTKQIFGKKDAEKLKKKLQ